jgi:hypothetical protein
LCEAKIKNVEGKQWGRNGVQNQMAKSQCHLKTLIGLSSKSEFYFLILKFQMNMS